MGRKYFCNFKMSISYHCQTKQTQTNLCSNSFQGAAIDRILGEIVHHNDIKAPIDYVLCIGHFLPKVINLSYNDENIAMRILAFSINFSSTFLFLTCKCG